MSRARSAVLALGFCSSALVGLEALAKSETACPARVVKDERRGFGYSGVVESPLPRISLDEAARRVLAGAHAVKLVSVRGYCLRIHRGARDGVAEGAALVENVTGAALAARVRELQAPQIVDTGTIRVEVSWQRIRRFNAPEGVDDIDYVADPIGLETAEDFGISRGGFSAPESDPLRNAYFVADNRESLPLSAVGRVVSYRHSGSLYAFDAKNPIHPQAGWRPQIPVGYDSERFGVAYPTVTGIRDLVDTADFLRKMQASEVVRSLVLPSALRYLDAITTMSGLILVLNNNLLEGFGPWLSEVSDLVENFAFLGFDEASRGGKFEIAIPSNPGGPDGYGSFARVPLVLQPQSFAGEAMFRNGHSWLARMTPDQVDGLARTDNPFLTYDDWSWTEL